MAILNDLVVKGPAKFLGSVDANLNVVSAEKLTTSAGGGVNPIYFSGGKPVACAYSLNKSVPGNAVFTDNNVKNTLATTTKAYITGTTSSTTNTGTQVFDTGVYLDTTAGMLTATTFKGNLTGTADIAKSLNKITDGYYLGTLNAKGVTHGASYRLQCQHNKFGDNRFGLKIESGHEVRCDYATYATKASQVDNLRTGTKYSDAFSTSLTDAHACWGKWCVVTGNGLDSASTAADYVPNSPYKRSAVWFEVLTSGVSNRAFQLAIGCYSHQRHMFIRYKHDGTWSGWFQINTTAI